MTSLFFFNVSDSSIEDESGTVDLRKQLGA
jgi:hypothetical protein